jgi:hypothetical protein
MCLELVFEVGRESWLVCWSFEVLHVLGVVGLWPFITVLARISVN